MPDNTRVGDLEIDQDLRFQKREWAFERASWVVMALVVLAGLLGLLGRGPMSDQTAVSGDGLVTVELRDGERQVVEVDELRLVSRTHEHRATPRHSGAMNSRLLRHSIRPPLPVHVRMTAVEAVFEGHAEAARAELLDAAR